MIIFQGALMTAKNPSSHHREKNAGQATKTSKKAGINSYPPEDKTDRTGLIPPHILEQAVELVALRTKNVTRDTAMHFDISEPLKHQAWNRLHSGRITANNVAAVLEAWVHREIATFGNQGNPNRDRLREWADEITIVLQKATRAFANP